MPRSILRLYQLAFQTLFWLVSSLLFVLCFSLVDDHAFSGEVIGQVLVGLICDRVGRKAALVITTLLIVIGATLATAAHGAHGSVHGLLWFVAIARGITGVVSVSLPRWIWPASHADPSCP